MAGGGLAPTGVAKERADQYQGRVTLYVVIACIVAAVGGSIFGYDIGILGGVTFMDEFLHDFFPSVYINKIWQCSSLVESCSRCWDRIRKPGYSIIPIRNGTNASTRLPQHDVSISNYARNLYSEHGKLWKSKA